MKEKKQSALSRLMGIAGGHKYFTYASCVLAILSAWIALIPFYDIWRIMKEILEVRPDFADATHIKTYGWQAVGFALFAMVVYIAALMCSHIAAFRVQANMRTAMMEHIMKLPLGYVEIEGTGKLRKVVNDSSAATETFLAHNLPDKVVSVATPVGLLVVMFVFDWRLGIASLIPAVLAFIMMGTLMMGPKMAEDMKQYQNALETMSSEAVEYVRGIPVVKTFGQTVYSFKKFKAAIDDYEKWTLDYTKGMMKPMVLFTMSANEIFAALIIVAYILGGNHVSNTFVLNLIFYILITSVLTTTLMKIAYAGESQMLVEDALQRMDDILNAKPLVNTGKQETPKDASITMEEDGSFAKVNIYGKEYSGKALFDILETYVRKAFFSDDRLERQKGSDIMWYIWTAPYSPLYGRNKMATFERYFIDDDDMKIEKKNFYYDYINKPECAQRILEEFGLHDKRDHIINGHVPVHRLRGESPVKCDGRVIVIDGGFSKAYRRRTGIAGYTLIYNSYGLTLTAHEPFESPETAVRDERDIVSRREAVEVLDKRILVGDTDAGIKMKEKIADLKHLIAAYRSGEIAERDD